MDGKIYVYVNEKKRLLTGKVSIYIGQTTKKINERAGSDGWKYIRDNKNKTCKFANAIEKWGWSSFEGKILIDNVETKEELDKLERLFIAIFDTYENGYNSTKGGGGSLGCHTSGMYGKHLSDESKKKISDSKKGKCSGENHPMYGKKHSEETKNKIKEARKKQTGENHPMHGKKLDEGRKEKLLKACEELWKTEEFRKMQSEKALGNEWAIRRKVFCVELDMTFDCINDAKKYMMDKYNQKCHNISYACNGKRETCGVIVINEEKIKLHWKYIDTVND